MRCLIYFINGRNTLYTKCYHKLLSCWVIIEYIDAKGVKLGCKMIAWPPVSAIYLAGRVTNSLLWILVSRYIIITSQSKKWEASLPTWSWYFQAPSSRGDCTSQEWTQHREVYHSHRLSPSTWCCFQDFHLLLVVVSDMWRFHRVLVWCRSMCGWWWCDGAPSPVDGEEEEFDFL